jgi:hypothetical protein
MCIGQFTVTVSPITSAHGTDRAEQATTFLCLTCLVNINNLDWATINHDWGTPTSTLGCTVDTAYGILFPHLCTCAPYLESVSRIPVAKSIFIF